MYYDPRKRKEDQIGILCLVSLAALLIFGAIIAANI